MEKCELFIEYQDSIIQVQELGGMDHQFIVFNPEFKDSIPDYKIQFTHKLMLKIEGSNKLIPILEFPEDQEFTMIDSAGNIIGQSTDTHPEFIEILFKKLEKDGTLKSKSMELN